MSIAKRFSIRCLPVLLLLIGAAHTAHAQCSIAYTFTGRADTDEELGWAVSGVGDVDGDGYADVIVGEWGNDADGQDVGKAYVYSGLTGHVLWTVAGEDTTDRFGLSVSDAGDVNNDGVPDVIVGALWNDAVGFNSGRAYVYSGTDGSPLWTFDGEAAGDNHGFSVSGAGDVDNDGFDDLIVGAHKNDAAGAEAGRAYVYSGQTGNVLWTFTGEAADDVFGYSVSGAGDVDADGYADVIVGARWNDAGGADAGRAYVYSGQTGAVIWTFTGEAADDAFGVVVSDAGDVNNDGFADVIIGSAKHDPNGVGAAGRAYVFSGQTGTLLWTFDGEAAQDLFGSWVSGAGDVDADGFADLIIGAIFNDAGGGNAGRAYVYSGQTGALLHTFTGETAEDWFGRGVSGAGDVDSDGYDDLIVGAPINPDATPNTGGHAYIYSGQSGALIRRLSTEVGSDINLGGAVSGAGDVNADGYADLIVGVSANEANGYRAGRAYVFSGQNGKRLYTFTGEAEEDLMGVHVSGAGDVNADGFDDVVVGAALHDAAGINAGRVYAFSGQDGDTLWIFDGESAGDLFSNCSGAGDVNSDGYDDVIVGASGGGPWRNQGRAYVYSGQSGALLHVFTGEVSDDYFGGAVSGADDVNGDGHADLIVGAWGNDDGGDLAGKTYVYSGSDGTLIHTFTGEAAGDLFGQSVSGAGDVDGDGYGDIIVGARWNDIGGNNAGRAYVYSGLTGALIHVLTGEAADDEFGFSVSVAGDLDADGHSDVLVGSPRIDANGVDAGRTYVYSGATGVLLFTFTGEAAGDAFGFRVASGGDVNGNGLADVIVGAPTNDAGGANAGRAYVFTCIPPAIPTLTEWGMILLGLLLLGGLGWYARRMRTLAATTVT